MEIPTTIDRRNKPNDSWPHCRNKIGKKGVVDDREAAYIFEDVEAMTLDDVF